MKSASSRSLSFQVSRLYVTCLGIGFTPKASGTAASAVALVFWAGLHHWNVSNLLLLALNFFFFLLSGPAVRAYEKVSGAHDSSEIVIDEWIGVGISVLASDFSTAQLLAAFVLFRVFDIWKPMGVKYFDRNYLNGWGVILDDVVAGVYAAFLLGVYRWILSAFNF